MKMNTVADSGRAKALLLRAARRIGISISFRLPEVFEVDLPPAGIPFQTPLLMGVRRPFLLFPVHLLKALSDEEVELVLLHELAHLVRRDHWGRWMLLWISNVASLTLLAVPLKQAIIEIEERLCDRWAIRSAQDALLLANALKVVSAVKAMDVSSKGYRSPVTLIPKNPAMDNLLAFGIPSPRVLILTSIKHP